MLAPHQYQQLLGIMSEDEARFEDLQRKFTEVFQKHDYFRAGWVVQQFIQHDVPCLFKPPRRCSVFASGLSASTFYMRST